MVKKNKNKNGSCCQNFTVKNTVAPLLVLQTFTVINRISD